MNNMIKFFAPPSSPQILTRSARQRGFLGCPTNAFNHRCGMPHVPKTYRVTIAFSRNAVTGIEATVLSSKTRGTSRASVEHAKRYHEIGARGTHNFI